MIKTFKSLICRINKLTDLKKYIILFFMFLLSSFVCFSSGAFHFDTSCEKIAGRITNLVNNETIDGKYAAMVISQNTNDKNLPSEYQEYNYWKYIFRHSNYGYVSTVNAKKEHEIIFSEAECENRITFICSTVNTCYRYKNGYYKHELYDLFFMFEGNRTIIGDAINFCAISKNVADSILEKRGIVKNGEYSEDDYRALLGTNTTLSFDGTNYYFSIFNVYLEDSEFCTNTRTVFNEFVLSYTKFPVGYDRESTYVFNSFNYQNYHKIKRILSIFNTSDYSYCFSKSNFKNGGYADDNVIVSFFTNTENNYTYISIMLTILSFSLYIVSFMILFFISTRKKYLPLVISITSLFVPYLLFFLIHLFVGINALFSYHSLKAFAFVIMVSFFFVFFFIISRKRKVV